MVWFKTQGVTTVSEDRCWQDISLHSTILYIFNHYMWNIMKTVELWWFNHILTGIWGPVREETAFCLRAHCCACIPLVTVTVMKKQQPSFSSLATEMQMAVAVTGWNISLNIVLSMIVFIPPSRLTFKHRAMNVWRFAFLVCHYFKILLGGWSMISQQHFKWERH